MGMKPAAGFLGAMNEQFFEDGMYVDGSPQ
jgi:hypothetical protein